MASLPVRAGEAALGRDVRTESERLEGIRGTGFATRKYSVDVAKQTLLSKPRAIRGVQGSDWQRAST
jgi:hypothetical protein